MLFFISHFRKERVLEEKRIHEKRGNSEWRQQGLEVFGKHRRIQKAESF